MMSLVLLEGFEHYGTGDNGKARMLAGMWAQVGSYWTLVDNMARTGSKSLYHDINTTSVSRIVFGSNTEVIGVGFGIRLQSLPAANNRVFFNIRDVSNTEIATVCIQSDGSIEVKRGSEGGTSIEITDAVITAGTFHHIEFRALIDDTVGEFELRVNGITLIQLGGLNLGTIYSSSFGISSAFTQCWIDDLFIWNGEGSLNNDFLGPLRVLTVYADGDGTPQDWSVIGATDAYDAVNEVTPDDDESYIGSDTVGDKATLTMPELPPEVSAIAGIFVPVYARIEEAGTGQINLSMISDGSSYYGGDTTPLTSSYTYWPFSFDYDPATLGVWTKSAFEAASIQLEKTL